MPIPDFPGLRQKIRDLHRAAEGPVLRDLVALADLSPARRQAIVSRAKHLITDIRGDSNPGIMEVFLSEYGLSTDEGIALMCLAEALLRVPDAPTMDALIEDKIAPSDWGKHLGHSSSSLVNASTWALMLTGKVLEDGNHSLTGALRGAVKRLGEPVIRTAVAAAMREMGRQFVLGQDIGEAIKHGRNRRKQGYTHSYDMLGEAAQTERDAKRYHLAYSDAITSLAKNCTSDDIRDNPGISVKLSALHSRYETAQAARVMDELVPRTRSLALLAKSAGMGFNIDAEEAARLDLSLDVIAAVLADPSLAGWDGFGVVVQAYGQRASAVLDWLYALAKKLDRKIMVRLVKGAYWDTEIKLAQTLGVDGFPVFTRKTSTDVSFIACARKLLGLTDRIYPQFATHNAHTVAAVLEMAKGRNDYEFQRLHGMGGSLHDIVMKQENTRCRIYAPVGPHRDLLAYLVRRLLENGANSSFVNQIVDLDVPAAEVAADPFAAAKIYLDSPHNPKITRPADLFGAHRTNAAGWDIDHPGDLAAIEAARAPFLKKSFHAGPMLATKTRGIERHAVLNPANPKDLVGHVTYAGPQDIESALNAAAIWDASPDQRARTLGRAADLYEENFGRLFALAAREAGKSVPDAIGELREAVDFLRYYGGEASKQNQPPLGVVAAISPWNFPLAIFTGQIAAALAAGNAVIAKPAEQTSLMAGKAVELLLQAGVPRTALQLLSGQGSTVGAALSADPRIDGFCFTGSTATAQNINRAMAKNQSPHAPLIAETGGLNAMIVDSTALPEAAVRDILASAFQSAGQRCSALRVLYVQRDIRDGLIEMLSGAMDDLRLGDPWHLATDIGPVIDQTARHKIQAHIDHARREGRLIKQLIAPDSGTFIAPALIAVDGIGDLAEEVFGPVLHVASFEADEIEQVIADINASGFGLTFGLHTRIDDRVQQTVDRVQCGNIYVNRNQIGAVVGSQPFGGEGLSGTGPKAGGASYVAKLTTPKRPLHKDVPGKSADETQIQKALDLLGEKNLTAFGTRDLPGPTGESNRLTDYATGTVLCLGPGAEFAKKQAAEARAQGCQTLSIADGADINGVLAPTALSNLQGFAAAAFWGGQQQARAYRQALAQRTGAILPLITSTRQTSVFRHQRHLCVDTTAAGGNAALLAGAGG